MPESITSMMLEKLSAGGLEMSKARILIPKIQSIDLAMNVRDAAKVYEEVQRIKGESHNAVNDAAECRMWAERRAGELLKAQGVRAGGSKSRPSILKANGVTLDESSRWQAFAKVKAETFQAHLNRMREGDGISAAGMLKQAASRNVQRSDSHHWYTPAVYIEAAREVLGGIDLDPASSEEANETVKARKFYSDTDDGLSMPWSGKVWLNPPYGDLAPLFIARLIESRASSEVTDAVCLVNSHATDAAWFQPLWVGHLCFTDHRIDFINGKGEKSSGSTHGSVFVYFGDDADRFVASFSQFGAVVRKIG